MHVFGRVGAIKTGIRNKKREPSRLAVDQGRDLLVNRHGDHGADHALDKGEGHVEHQQALPEVFD